VFPDVLQKRGDDVIRRLGDVDCDGGLIRVWQFKCGELTGKKGRWHEMPGAGLHPLGDDRLTAMQMQKRDRPPGIGANDIAVISGEGRASDDHWQGRLCKGLPHLNQPRRAVGIPQRFTCGHLGDVLGRMQVVAIHKRGINAGRKGGANRRLAAP